MRRRAPSHFRKLTETSLTQRLQRRECWAAHAAATRTRVTQVYLFLHARPTRRFIDDETSAGQEMAEEAGRKSTNHPRRRQSPPSQTCLRLGWRRAQRSEVISAACALVRGCQTHTEDARIQVVYEMCMRGWDNARFHPLPDPRRARPRHRACAGSLCLRILTWRIFLPART